MTSPDADFKKVSHYNLTGKKLVTEW